MISKRRSGVTIGRWSGGLAVLGVAGALAGAPLVAAGPEDAALRQAARASAEASRALSRRLPDAAIALAERAVALAPDNPAYRALLGRSYSRAGRFASARAMLTEALALNPTDGRAALDLALAQAAGGDARAALATLDAHAGALAPADLGLALALAGEPGAGARLLLQAARQPGATARVRQNLALSLALGGDWQMARVIAAADVKPADLDRRIADWALMAQGDDPGARVARFLGVAAVADPGRPQVLALRAQPAAAVATALPAAPTSTVPAPMPASAGAVVFADRREVVQAIPAGAGAGAPRPATARVASRRLVRRPPLRPLPRADGGVWFVQLGAYETEAVARDAWGRMVRRVPGFAAYRPAASDGRRGTKGFYQLAVGGFAERDDATRACLRLKRAGGRCYVRTFEGERLVRWLGQGTAQLASR